jgi:anti-sigma factor RsiW
LSRNRTNGRCQELPADLLSAWVDGEAGARAETAGAHIAGCPVCEARVTELRGLKSRLSAYGAATHAAAPAGLVTTALDQARHVSHGPRPAPRLRLAIQVAVVLLVCTAAVAALWPILAARRPIPVEALSESIPEAVVAGPDRLVTFNPDAASAWLREKLDFDVPVVSLSLVQAEMIGARYDEHERAGELVYRDRAGQIVSLHIYPARKIDRRSLRSVVHSGTNYFLIHNPKTGVGVAAWEGERVNYAAVGRMRTDDLLRFAHEMARRCH